MNKFISKAFLVFLVVLLGSCATLSEEEKNVMKRQLQPGEQVIGTVNAVVTGGLFDSTQTLYDNAYNALLTVARRQYQGDIDIRDIVLDLSGVNFNPVQQFPATGKVIRR